MNLAKIVPHSRLISLYRVRLTWLHPIRVLQRRLALDLSIPSQGY